MCNSLYTFGKVAHSKYIRFVDNVSNICGPQIADRIFIGVQLDETLRKTLLIDHVIQMHMPIICTITATLVQLFNG